MLASDVLYEARNVPALLALLPRLTAASGEVWLADPGRASAARFLDVRARATWRIDAIPHDGPAHVTVHRLGRRRGAPRPLARSPRPSLSARGTP